jgi:DNA-binding Lrp family transcriptional regulator
LSYYEKLVPSKHFYFTKFKHLDKTDLQIIFEMRKKCPEGPRNVRKIAQRLDMPQQTVNYRVRRFEHLNLVRFRAVSNESVLGLENYAVMTTVKPGLLYESGSGDVINAGTFLTCHPVWRLLKEIHGGFSHGFFVQYSIPSGGGDGLRLFLEELREIGCIEKIDDFCRITSSYFNTPPLDLYLEMAQAVQSGRKVSFDWRKWADDFEQAEPAIPPEEAIRKKKIPFTYEHLLVLSHLERDLRESFASIAKSIGERSAKVSQWFKEILLHNLIGSCKVEIYPDDPTTTIQLVLKLEFADEVALRKFISHLDKMPYPATYQKVFQKNAIFLHTAVPPHEYFSFHNAFETLNRRHDTISQFAQFVGNHVADFDNIKLFEAFSKKENDWIFSYEELHSAFERLRDDTKFQF